MSDIYGKVTEHFDAPELDEGRFTVEIKPHAFRPRQDGGYVDGFRFLEAYYGFAPTCHDCPFRQLHPVHEVTE